MNSRHLSHSDSCADPNFDQPKPQSARRLTASVAAVVALSMGTLVACSTDDESNGDGNPLETRDNDGGDSQSESQDPPEATALSDGNRTGVDTVGEFYEDFDTVVVAANDEQSLRKAGTVAVDESAPMLTALPDFAAGLGEFLDSHDVDTIITVGEPSAPEGKQWSQWADDVESSNVTEDAEDAEQSLPYSGDRIAGLVGYADENGNAEDDSDEDDEQAPIFVTETTAIASVASALSSGKDVTVLDAPDIRATSESMEAARTGDIITMGDAFGDQSHVDRTIELAENGELPGGGGLVFPGRRMIALYGHPSGPTLGAMGEQGPQEAVQRVQGLVDSYQDLDDEPTIPAFEIISTIAAAQPGPNNLYTNYSEVEELQPYVDAIVNADGYAFLDLQPGRESLLNQAKHYEELLKLPNVGLAIDPEWKLEPHEVPLTNVGHVDAAEINEVADWLAQLVSDNNLPQKGLIVHQFQHQMIRNRDQVNTHIPELSFILHADGHGPPDTKFATWDMVRSDLSDDWFMAWKNFIDEDSPMFTEEQTYDINPTPWFVSYQ